ncbi:MAG: glycosyltransferase family 2 protein [Paraglaciecola sp.]|uniref:glycosyltransferase family 2 protein n=1 Tax=Paraglaciecola sp. TaxID=1920173 RepID=UPI003297DC24
MEEPIRRRQLVSLIAPMYNEEEVIGVFFSTIDSTLKDVDVDYEIICVNDGSTDSTLDILKSYIEQNNRIKIIDLSRNHGKELALTAGLDYASGDAAIPIDCDLQDPPEVIIEMIKKWQEGYQVVLAKRIDRTSDSWLKRWTSSLFYKLIDNISDIHIPANVGDFRLLDRVALEVIKTYRERTRFMKGLFASLGFKETTIEYIRAPRAAGETKWNYWKLYKLALEGIISLTSLPLKIWSYIGAGVAISGFIYGVYLIVKTLVFGVDSPGYASLMVVLLFMSGLILLCLGVIGEYLSRLFVEIKARPLYIVMETVGFDESSNDS